MCPFQTNCIKTFLDNASDLAIQRWCDKQDDFYYIILLKLLKAKQNII